MSGDYTQRTEPHIYIYIYIYIYIVTEPQQNCNRAATEPPMRGMYQQRHKPRSQP